jgi:hypothetical protein
MSSVVSQTVRENRAIVVKQIPEISLPKAYVSPADWDRYCQWLRLAEGQDGTNILVPFGTNVVTVDDCLSFAPGEWFRDNILH